MNERLEIAYGKVMRALAKQEGHKPLVPTYFGGDKTRDFSAQRRGRSQELIMKALPGTTEDIAQRTHLSFSATRENLIRLNAAGKAKARFVGATKVWVKV